MKSLASTKRIRTPQHRGVVLLYHRINNLENDPWQLAVTPELFSSQLAELNSLFTLKSLNDIYTPEQNGKIPIYITFDDGYRDNLQIAKPILENHGAPCTFFITSSAIDAKDEFWWDALERIVFDFSASELAQILDLRLFEPSFVELIKIHLPIKICGKFCDTRKLRRYLYFRLWNYLYQKNNQTKAKIINSLMSISGAQTSQRKTHQTLSTEELHMLIEPSLFDVGGHGTTHDALGNIDNEIAYKEIKSSHQFLSKFSANVGSFSYPHGSVPACAASALSEMDVDFAFTTKSGFISDVSLPFEIPRLTVCNYSPEKLIWHIKNTLD